MSSKKLLLTPGPTNIPERYLKIFGQDIIHHRTPEFRRILKESNENLKKVFKTKNDVAVVTSSGTGAMEAAVVNFFSKGDKVIVINTGYFGERFKKIAEIYGLNVINLGYEFGDGYELEDVKKALAENPDIKGILATHSETAVGILNDIKALGELTKNTDILLVVDTISGLVANDFDFDGWHVDVAIAGSQKAFLIPPGLSFVAMSDKAKKAMEKSDLPKYYFSMKQYQKYFDDFSETPYTPAISLILALHKSLEDLINKGIESSIKEKYELRKLIEEKAQKLGFNLLVKKEENRTNTLVSIYREGVIIKDIISALEDKGYTVTGGKGKFGDSLMRIGILGEISKEQINDFFILFEEELKKQLGE
jgi:soluble hydrogenase, small subunit